MVKTIGLMFGVGLFSTLATAQSTQDPLAACYQQPDGAPRLACFNKEMQRRQAASTASSATTAAPVASAAASAPPVVKTNSDENVGLQGEALRKKLKAEGIKTDPIKPIVATIVRLVPLPHDEQVFVLDNGQTWEEVGSMSNLNVKLHDKVTIKPGFLGGFFLNTPESQRIRVQRIS